MAALAQAVVAEEVGVRSVVDRSTLEPIHFKVNPPPPPKNKRRKKKTKRSHEDQSARGCISTGSLTVFFGFLAI